MTSDGTDSEPLVLTDVTDRIGTITMNRPSRRNALNGPLIMALDAAVKTMADDDEVKVVILTGAAPEGGSGGFCSGGDTKDGGFVPDPDVGVPLDALEGDLARHDRNAPMLLHLMPKPTIAMIGGPAVGAGFSLAAACDLRYMADDAILRSGFVPNGLSGDYGGSFLWTRIVGTAVARELYLLNEEIPPARASDLGMVHAVVPARELADHTWAIAQRLLRVSGAVLGLVKDNLNQAEDEIERRRFLFANEAGNQISSARRRMKN